MTTKDVLQAQRRNALAQADAERLRAEAATRSMESWKRLATELQNQIEEAEMEKTLTR